MLEFVQVVIELLEAFNEGGKVGGNARVGIDSGLGDPLLVEQRLET